MSTDLRQLCICMPTRDKRTKETRWALEHNTPPHKLIIERGKPVDVARNHLARRILALPQVPEIVVLVEDDAWWVPGTVEKLFAVMPDDADLFVPLFGVREGRAPCTIWRDENDRNSWLRPGVNCDDDDIIPVRYCGLHFALLRTSVLRQLGPDAFSIPSGKKIAEDAAFCGRMSQAGMKIAASTDTMTAHVDASSGLAFWPGQPAAVIPEPSRWRPATVDEIMQASVRARPFGTHQTRGYGPALDGVRVDLGFVKLGGAA